MSTFKKSTTAKTLSIFWQYTSRYKALFFGGAFGAALGVLAQDVIPPFIISRAFVRLQVAYATHLPLHFAELTAYLVGLTASLLIGVVFWRLQGYAVWQFEIQAQRDLIIDIFHHLEKQGQKFHADRFGGALVSQANKFISGYERLMDEFIWSVVPSVTAFAASVGVLFVVAYKFAVVMSVIVAIYLAVMWRRVKHQFPFNRREAERESERTAALADAITNIGNIRAFAHEDYELKRFTVAAKRSYEAYKELSVETFKNDSISHSMTNSLRIVAFLFGVYAVTNLHTNAGVLYLVVSYTGTIYDRLWQFGRTVRNINRSFGDSAEMTEILQLKPEIVDPQRPEKVHITRGAIEFRNVYFDHGSAQSESDVLFKDLSLKIKPGEKVGLVGPSGSGKTTLTGLLLRFMDIQRGVILIDSQDISQLAQTDLRSRITYVAQDPILFHRSLADNIRYGQLDITEKAITATAKMANAHEFIEKLPHGYETMVGERGVELSGGQRQRVAIARAMLKNAPILVLDEATSALDSESEALIQDALWKLMEGRTAIVIAHRLSTIQRMDRIVVLEDGQIVEQGTHKELINAKGVYAGLWQRQSGGFIEE